MRSLEEKDLYYFRNLLFLFTCGVHKVATDNEGVVWDIYSNIRRNREIIHTWLSLMSYKPSHFVVVPVNISEIDDEELKFLTLCKSTNGQKKMIVSDLQSLRCSLDCDNCTTVDGVKVHIMDKDEAVNEVAVNNNHTTIIDSVIANGNVSNSNNNV